jgi:hypothetical protein
MLHDGNELLGRLDAIIFTLTPWAVIAVLYTIIIYSIVKSGRNYRKLLFRSSMIVVMCLIAYTPTFLFEAGVRMDYVCAQVLTVTLYYVNCVFDPIMYVYSDPKVTGSLRKKSSSLYIRWKADQRRRGSIRTGTVRGRLPSYQSENHRGTNFANSSRNQLIVSR